MTVSRRAMLSGGLGLAALGTVGLTTAPHLVLNYRPSQPTGWWGTPGQSHATTLGGHTPSKAFVHNGRTYRISTLPLAYVARPTRNFRTVLGEAFGTHYSFRYATLRGQGEFNVQSYGVFADEATETAPETHFGGGLYVEYQPSPGDPRIGDDLHWIQVASSLGGPGVPSQVDNMGRANPFYSFGGLTSINGTTTVNFHDIPQNRVHGVPTVDTEFLGEVFLVRETGNGTLTIFGGVTWGWRVAR